MRGQGSVRGRPVKPRLFLFFGLFLPSLLLLGGCASTEKPVALTYERFVNATGGTGEVYVTRPPEKPDASGSTGSTGPAMLPGGRLILGKSRETDADVVTRQSVTGWIADALAEELRAAGYTVRVVTELPRGAEKGLKTSIQSLSADQYSKALTLSTVVEIKLAVEIWRRGDLLKTLTAGAREEREGFDRSSEPIRQTLQNTLQRVMQELIPDVVKNLR